MDKNGNGGSDIETTAPKLATFIALVLALEVWQVLVSLAESCEM